MVGDSFENVFAAQAEVFGFDYQRLDLPLQQLTAGAQSGALRRSDHGADSGMRFQKAFGEQRGDDLVRGVGVDMLFAAEDSHRRKGVSRAELAGDDRTLGCVDDLLEDRNAGPKLDVEGRHSCTITDSTAGGQEKFATYESEFNALKEFPGAVQQDTSEGEVEHDAEVRR